MPAECEAVADLLDPLADGEIPPSAAAEVRQHLAGCPACAAEFAAIQSLRGELARLPRELAPDGLRRRILAALPSGAEPPRRQALGRLAAGFAGLLLGAAAARLLGGRPESLAPHDLVAAHARSLLAEAPPQVATSDTHRIRPWVSTRLPLAPRVLEIEGFPLLGARLDLVAGQPVAALLYRRRGHAITIFATTAAAAPGWPRQAEIRDGFQLVPWIADGVHYVAVSDLNRAELLELCALLGGR